MREMIIGLDSILDELTYRIQAGSMVFVEGRKGNGKTALLKSLIRRLRGRRRVIYMDCRTVKLDIEEVMQKRYGLLGRFLRITPKRMVLLADNLSGLSVRNVEKLQFFFDNNHLTSVIFTGESYAKSNLPKSLRDRIGTRVIKLPAFTDGLAIEIARTRFKEHFPENVIKKVFKLSESVSSFIANYERLIKYAERHSLKNITAEQVRTAIGKGGRRGRGMV